MNVRKPMFILVFFKLEAQFDFYFAVDDLCRYSEYYIYTNLF